MTTGNDAVPPSIQTPVALIIFKRTGPISKVLEVLREVEPPEMYIIGDGPREDADGEAERVQKAREFVENGIDWDCEIHTNYADRNMGGPRRIPTGLNWVFEHADEAIILEEDMLPSVNFFKYCELLLKEYDDNSEIMSICGNNAGSAPDVDTSYFFSNIFRTMGWATWREAWQHFDPELKEWPKLREENALKERYHLDVWAENHGRAFDFLYDNEDRRNYWDATWQYCIVANDGKTILPTNNLVVHIGYGEDASHTKQEPIFQRLMLPQRESIFFPLHHPERVELSREFEQNYKSYKHGKLSNLLTLIDRALYRIHSEIRNLL